MAFLTLNQGFKNGGNTKLFQETVHLHLTFIICNVNKIIYLQINIVTTADQKINVVKHQTSILQH